MADVTRKIGLSLGADLCWPAAYEALVKRLDLAIPHKKDTVRFEVERVTVEPFDLRYTPSYDLVIDRLTHWFHTSREWVKKIALDGSYTLNNPWATQSMEKHTTYVAMMKLGLISKRLADVLNGLAILVSAVLFLLFAFFIYSDSGNTLNLPSKGQFKGQYLDPATPDFFVALTWLGWIAFCGYLAWAGASMLLAAFHNRQPNRLRNHSAATGLKPPLDGHEYRKETVPRWLVLCVVALLGYAFVQGFLRIGA